MNIRYVNILYSSHNEQIIIHPQVRGEFQIVLPFAIVASHIAFVQLNRAVQAQPTINQDTRQFRINWRRLMRYFFDFREIAGVVKSRSFITWE